MNRFSLLLLALGSTFLPRVTAATDTAETVGDVVLRHPDPGEEDTVEVLLCPGADMGREVPQNHHVVTCRHPSSIKDIVINLPVELISPWMFRHDPGQVSGLGADQLRHELPARLADLTGLAPNFAIGDGGLRSFGTVYSLRGLGSTPYFSSPALATYVDGVVQGDAFANGSAILGAEEIELYRGPQNFLFGRSAPAGVVAIRTQAPADQPRARGEFILSERGRQDAQVAGQWPLVPGQWWMDGAVRFSADDGFLENPTAGGGDDRRESLAGRVGLTWRLDPAWTVRFQAQGERARDGAQRLVPLTQSWARVESDLAGRADTDEFRQSLTVRHAGEGWLLSSTTSHLDWNLEPFVADLDFTANPWLTSFLTQRQRQWTEELRWESTDRRERGWWWRAVAFYLDADTAGFVERTFFGDFERARHRLDEQSAAAFGYLGKTFAEDFDLSLGLRYDRTEKRLRRDKTSSFGADPHYDFRRAEDALSPTLEAIWRMNPEWLWTARSGLAWRPGGYSAYTGNVALAPFDAERTWVNEIGWSWQPNDRVTLEWNGFWYQVRDFQVERSFTPFDYLVVNAPEVTSRGIELTLQSRPVDGLRLDLAAGWLDATFDRYRDPIDGSDYAGRRTPYAPEFTLRAAVEYRHSCGGWARVAARWAGESFYNEANEARFRQPGYALLDASVGWENERWGVFLFGRNLTDERYFSYIFSDLRAGTPGEPRLLGLGATLQL